MPLVSVLMSVYKEPKSYLVQSIESILNQTFSDFEFIIIIDNPLNTDAINLIRNYCKVDHRIKLFINESNLGLTASLNKGLKECSGEYIARMDADDVSDCNRFELQYLYTCQNKCDLVGCEVRRINEKGEIVNQRTNKSYNSNTINKLILFDDCIAHPSWFVKKELYYSLNGYRPMFACEDYDFLLRAREAGAVLGICDTVLLSYRINQNSISNSSLYKQYLASSYLRKKYKRINNISVEEVDSYLLDKHTINYEKRYKQALDYMNQGISEVHKHNLFGLIRLFQALVYMPVLFDNYFRIGIMGVIKANNGRIK